MLDTPPIVLRQFVCREAGVFLPSIKTTSVTSVMTRIINKNDHVPYLSKI